MTHVWFWYATRCSYSLLTTQSSNEKWLPGLIEPKVTKKRKEVRKNSVLNFKYQYFSTAATLKQLLMKESTTLVPSLFPYSQKKVEKKEKGASCELPLRE